MHDVDDGIDVFVCLRGLFDETFQRSRLGDDLEALQAIAQLGAVDLLLRAHARHRPSRAVTGRPETLAHRGFLPEEKVRGGTHTAGDEDRLAGERARRPFAMDDVAARAAVDPVLL